MADFVKIGTKRINLDNVTVVSEHRLGDAVQAKVFFTHAEGSEGSSAFIRLNDDEGRLLLAILDKDDEQVDALYPVVNG